MSTDQQAPELPPLGPRLARAFAAPRAQRAALIPYVTGGHPDLETSSRVIGALIDAGADIVELGIPFSDPIADGPVVQRSTHEALLAGVTPDDVLQLAAAHSGSAPFVLLTYVNTVLALGPERFFARAAASGVEALVIPDLPLDEAAGGAARGGRGPARPRRTPPRLHGRAAGCGLRHLHAGAGGPRGGPRRRRHHRQRAHRPDRPQRRRRRRLHRRRRPPARRERGDHRGLSR